MKTGPNVESCPYCQGTDVPGCYCIPLTFNTLCPMSDELRQSLESATAAFNALSIEQRAEHRRAQRESWVRAEASWPEPNYSIQMRDGVSTKVYESFEDYCNG